MTDPLPALTALICEHSGLTGVRADRLAGKIAAEWLPAQQAQALRDAVDALGELWVKHGRHPGRAGCYSPGYEHWLDRRADRLARAAMDGGEHD